MFLRHDSGCPSACEGIEHDATHRAAGQDTRCDERLGIRREMSAPIRGYGTRPDAALIASAADQFLLMPGPIHCLAHSGDMRVTPGHRLFSGSDLSPIPLDRRCLHWLSDRGRIVMVEARLARS